jgi:acyl CoA:acetate/3-ketoacid CoA transferase beta subunit
VTITIDEYLVFGLAGTVRPGDVVVIGVATPIAAAAALVAREALVDDVTVIAAATVDPAVHDLAEAMVAPEILDRLGVGTFTQSEILDQIQRGRISRQFVSPAQVDGLGRLNTSRIRRPDGSWLRLPGGLATADIAVLMGTLVAYRADHSPRFLPAEVDFVTGAGHARGDAWRTERELPGSGVRAVVTDKAILEWDGGWRVASVRAGVDPAEVGAGCGFEVTMPPDTPVTPDPPADALELLRSRIDPLGIRRLEVRETREAAAADLARWAASR